MSVKQICSGETKYAHASFLDEYGRFAICTLKATIIKKFVFKSDVPLFIKHFKTVNLIQYAVLCLPTQKPPS